MIWWNMVMKFVINKMVSYVYYCIFNCKDKDVSTFLGFVKVILYFFINFGGRVFNRYGVFL